MADLRFVTLFSGSSGNCEYIKYKNTEILIDAGKSARTIEKSLAALGTSIGNISAVFVTHEHSDHIAGVQVIAKRYGVPIHIVRESAGAMCELPMTLHTHDAVFDEQVGDICVKSFRTSHDSAMSVGYVVTAGEKRIGVATDMGIITKNVVEALTGCDCAVIESNYDEEMLWHGCYPESLKRRIASNFGHLSNDNGALLAAVLAFGGTKSIALGHLSAENNTPDIALSRARSELKKRELSADIIVADRFDPTVII